MKITQENIRAPIHDNQPSGIDIRVGGEINQLYHATKDARVEARNIERQRASAPEIVAPKALWQTVYHHSLTILTEHAKDLEICAWLIEASVRLYGFRGLADSFALCTDLIEKFWDSIYPLPDEEGLEVRLSALSGLNGYSQAGSLIQPISMIHLTQVNKGPFAFWQYKKALEIDKMKDTQLKKQREQALGITLQQLQQDFNNSNKAFIAELQIDLGAAQTQLTRYANTLDKKAGNDAPPTSAISATIDECKQQFQYLLTDSQFNNQLIENSTDNNEIEHNAPIESQTLVTIAPTSFHDSATTRTEALNSLENLARYFEKTEPHSPLPFLLLRAVHWGKLSLPKLLEEMIDDKQSLKSVFELTGIDLQNSS